jgi:hypothetical protein
MPDRPPLQPDPASIDAWHKLHQGVPSPKALPPVSGGLPWLRQFLIIALIIGIILMVMLLQGRLS